MPWHDPRNWVRLRPWTRHSLVLAVAGLVYVLIGGGYYTSPPSPERESSLRLALTWMPLPAWGVVFMAVGCMGILSSRWPIFSQKWGYTAMTALSSLWAGMFVGGAVTGAPVQNLTGALVFGLLAFLWWAISGLVNPGSGKAE